MSEARERVGAHVRAWVRALPGGFPEQGEQCWIEPARRWGWDLPWRRLIAFLDREPVAGFFSTPEGNKLYRTLGFRTVSALSRWLWMPGAGIPDSARGLSATPH